MHPVSYPGNTPPDRFTARGRTARRHARAVEQAQRIEFITAQATAEIAYSQMCKEMALLAAGIEMAQGEPLFLRYALQKVDVYAAANNARLRGLA